MLRISKTPSMQSIIGDAGLAEWRSKALTIILIVLAITGFPAYASVALSAFRRGNIVFLEIIYLAIYLALVILACLPRLNYSLRVWGLIGFSYVNAAASFMRLGLVGSGRLWLLILPAVATVVLGARAGYMLAALSLCVYASFYALATKGILEQWVVLRDNPFGPGFWIEGGAALVVFLCILVILVERFVSLQGRTLAGYKQSNVKLTEASRALGESEERLRLIGDNLPGGMIYQLASRHDGSRRFTYVSAGVKRLHGLSPEQVLADSSLLYNLLVDDDLERMIQAEKRSLDEMNQFDIEVRFHNASGGIQWSRIVSQPRPAGENTILSDGVEIDITRNKEAEEALRESENKYRMLNVELEHKVAERTDEMERANDNLLAANRELGEALRNLNDAQYQLIQSEKLAALGQLSAGIAHELNTPLGAIRSSIRSMIDIIQRKVPETAGLLTALSGRELNSFNTLLGESMERASRVDSLPERRNRAEIEHVLARAGIPHSDDLAILLSDLGLHDLKDGLADLLSVEKRDEILSTVSTLSSIRRLGEIISVASEKASGVIGALQSYMKPDIEELATDVYIHREIETILTLFHNRIKHGITVTRNFMTDKPVTGNRDRLNQLWINLLNNAFQAMNWKGSVAIETTEKDGWVTISIADSGPGIPEEIKGRIFEPFFTTKNTGEGMGLGLDICRKIVEKHGGTITFESVPGRTVFTVRLRAGAA